MSYYEKNRVDCDIKKLGLSTRTTNALLRSDIRTINQLLDLRDEEILKIEQIGESSLKEIRSRIKKYRENKDFIKLKYELRLLKEKGYTSEQIKEALDYISIE